MRDWDLIQEKRTPDFQKDPFKLVTTKALDKKLIEDAKIVLPMGSHGSSGLQPPHDSHSPQLPGNSRGRVVQEKESRAFAQRLSVALIGGLALLVPVIIMAVRKTLLKSLLTISVAVLLFSLAIAIFSHQTSVQVMSVTAAYTAVLAVFVGVAP